MSSTKLSEKRYLVDTHILVAILLGDSSVIDWLGLMENSPAWFFIGLQNICEFWNVSTRPADKNGLGLSPKFTMRALQRLQLGFRVLAENDLAVEELMALLQAHRVSGKQIYDAKLVALQRAHRLDGIMTFNHTDFVRRAVSNPMSPTGQIQ